MNDILITNGRVIDPANGLDMAADVAIAGGKIARVGRKIGGAFEKKFQQPLTLNSALGYFGTMVAIRALDAAKSFEPKDVADALHKVKVGKDEMITSSDYLEFDENGRNKGRDTTVTQFQGDKLVAVHEGDGHGVRPGGFGSGTFAEVTGRDDQSLLMGPQTTADLLHNRRLDAIRRLPSLHLDRHASTNDIADHERATADAARPRHHPLLVRGPERGRRPRRLGLDRRRRRPDVRRGPRPAPRPLGESLSSRLSPGSRR